MHSTDRRCWQPHSEPVVQWGWMHCEAAEEQLRSLTALPDFSASMEMHPLLTIKASDRNIISRNFNGKLMSLWLFVACICRKSFSIQSQHLFCFCFFFFIFAVTPAFCSAVVFNHVVRAQECCFFVCFFNSTSFSISWFHWFAHIQPENGH